MRSVVEAKIAKAALAEGERARKSSSVITQLKVLLVFLEVPNLSTFATLMGVELAAVAVGEARRV